jgi:hypothetical protein
VIEWLSWLASLAIVGSAAVSLGLLGVSYMQLKQTSATLQLANTAKSQADETSRRIHAVEDVLTMVDLASGGRKLCMAYASPTWSDLETGNAGDTSMYVPATWTAQACKNQAVKLGAGRFRLGCVFKEHASLGRFVPTSAPVSVALPSESCGW